MTDPRKDTDQADRDAHQKPKPAGAAPHYLRCEWYIGTNRCRLAKDHPGNHEYENPQAK